MNHGVLVAENTEKIDELKAIAMQELRSGSVQIAVSDESAKLNREAIKAYEALEGMLGNENMQFLVDMDESYMRASAFEAEDHFVEGFIRGFQYLKILMETETRI